MERYSAGLLFLLYLVLGIPGFLTAEKKVVVYERTHDSLTLVPAEIRDIYSAEVSFNIYEGLVTLDGNTLEVIPALADRWEIREGGKTWIFHLKKEIRFHDGTEFTARAVRYTFDYQVAQRERYPKFAMVKELISSTEVMDEYTVAVHLREPYVPFLAALSDPSFFIVPVNSYDGAGEKLIGTGPFRFREWKKNRYLILDKYEDYREPGVGLDTIVYRVQPEYSSRLLHLKNGNSDLLMIRSKTEEEALSNLEHIGILKNQKLQINYLGFNLRKGIFSDPRIRQAFAHSLNKTKLVRYIFQDLATPISAPLPPNLLDYPADLYRYDYDIEKSLAVFDAMVSPRAYPLTLLYVTGNTALQELATRISRNSARWGVPVTTVEASFQHIITRIENNEFDLFLLGYSSSPDPDLFLTPNFSQTGRFNNTGYTSREAEELLSRARIEFDPVRRKRLYRKVLEILGRDLPLIPLYSEECLVAHNRALRNLTLHPFGIILFRNAGFSR